MSNLVQRTLSGIVYVILFVGCIIYGLQTFCILFTITTALALNEFNHLINDHHIATVNNTISVISGVYLFLAFFCYASGHSSTIVFLPYILSLLFILIEELYLKSDTPIANWAYSFAGQLYIALPFALLNLVAFHGGNGYTYMLPLGIFVFIWLNDSGAYCIGTMLHKKIPYKLFERISPKKSWIGSIGGLVVVLIGAAVFNYFDKQGTLLQWMGLGITVVIFGTYGDLVESLIKRHLGIKDSGRFMPGHGGVLDRFDSALLAIPASVIFLYALIYFC